MRRSTRAGRQVVLGRVTPSGAGARRLETHSGRQPGATIVGEKVPGSARSAMERNKGESEETQRMLFEQTNPISY